MSGLFGKNRLRDLAREIPTDQITAHVELVRTWRDDYHSIDGRLKTDNETVREQQYNQDFFVTILGYRQPPNVPTTFTPKSTTAARQIPDAILHYKDATVDNMSAVIELKGAGINLDKPQRNCQDLWIGIFQATSVPTWSLPSESGWCEVMSVGRSRSLPL
jgi:hypothetical protein